MTRSYPRILAATLKEPIFPPVSRPVDLTDAEQFPEIAEALRHAAALRAKEAGK